MSTTQEINLAEIEETFGKDVVEKIKKHIEYAEKENLDFKIKTVEETRNFAELAFVTRSYAYHYDISLRRKGIVSENYIGWRACAEIVEIMKNLKAL